MSRDKQIEVMQNDLIAISKSPIMIDGLEHWSDAIAEELYNASYRKASEVIEDLFEEFEALVTQKDMPITTMALLATKEYADFKKKWVKL